MAVNMLPGQIVNEDQVIQDYTKLIHYAIQKFYPYRQGIEYEDLFQIGSIALLKAYRQYRSDREANFVTYAVLKLKSAMYDAIRKSQRDKRKGNIISLDAARYDDSEVCLHDAIADNRAAEEFDVVLLKICLKEGSYSMQKNERRLLLKNEPVDAAPVTTTFDLSNFIVFNASNTAMSRNVSIITITKSGKVTLSSSLGAQYQTGDKLEVLINQSSSVVVVRKSDNGIRCRINGKGTVGKTITCKALTNLLTKKKIDLPLRFNAEWDESVQGFIGRR